MKDTEQQSSAANGLGMVVLPFVVALVLMALIELGIPLPIYPAIGAAVLVGFVFLERSVGAHAAWLGAVYVPAMCWLVATFTGMLIYLFGFGQR